MCWDEYFPKISQILCSGFRDFYIKKLKYLGSRHKAVNIGLEY